MEEEARGSSMCTKRRLAVIVTFLTLVAVSLVAVSVGAYWRRQGPPPLLTPPYIRLEALLDEPMGHGWGWIFLAMGPLSTSLLCRLLFMVRSTGSIYFTNLATFEIAGPHSEACRRGST